MCCHRNGGFTPYEMETPSWTTHSAIPTRTLSARCPHVELSATSPANSATMMTAIRMIVCLLRNPPPRCFLTVGGRGWGGAAGGGGGGTPAGGRGGGTPVGGLAGERPPLLGRRRIGRPVPRTDLFGRRFRPPFRTREPSRAGSGGGLPPGADLAARGVAAAASAPARLCLISGAHWVRTRDTPNLTTHDRLRTAVTSTRAVAKPNPRGEICAPPQASHCSERARPRRFAVERAEGGLGRLRILRSCRDAA